MSRSEGEALIDETDRFSVPSRSSSYSHNWNVGDVMMWDQRATLHRGMPWPYKQPRTLASVCCSLTEADGLATAPRPTACLSAGVSGRSRGVQRDPAQRNSGFRSGRKILLMIEAASLSVEVVQMAPEVVRSHTAGTYRGEREELMTAIGGRPRVVVIGTGGTISFDGRHGLDTYEYVEFGTRHDIGEVLARFPELETMAEILPVSFRTLSSSAVSLRPTGSIWSRRFMASR